MIINNINHVSGINKKNSTNYIMSSNNTVFDSGKYSGKTFKEVYNKYPEYVNFISTHKYLKNPIYSSFNEYILKRRGKNIFNKKFNKLNKVIEKKSINIILMNN